MSGPPEARQVLAPAGNKARVTPGARKPSPKPPIKLQESDGEERKRRVPNRGSVWLLQSNLSLNASCSSDASADSFVSRASTGRMGRNGVAGRRKERVPRTAEKAAARVERLVLDGSLVAAPVPESDGKRRCGWVTANTDPCYASFHDEEWGVPVHDDRKLFELLVLSSSLAELTWPAILSRRHIFRDVFMDFDPMLVSKLNEKKIIAPGSTATSLLSEPKLRAIIENAREVVKIIEEFGSFDRYCWSFVNQRPIVSRFRYVRQVPAKTPKADMISKDLMRRGFRSVGPTVIYSFMQVAGITNDHLITCYRFEECNDAATPASGVVGVMEANRKHDIGGEEGLGIIDLDLVGTVDGLSILS